jgi:helix-turn-helix protein
VGRINFWPIPIKFFFGKKISQGKTMNLYQMLIKKSAEANTDEQHNIKAANKLFGNVTTSHTWEQGNTSKTQLQRNCALNSGNVCRK